MKKVGTGALVAGAVFSAGALVGCGELEAHPTLDGKYAEYQRAAVEIVDDEINENGTVAVLQALGCLSLETDTYNTVLEDPLFKSISMEDAVVTLWLPERPAQNVTANELFTKGVFTVIPVDNDAPYSNAEAEFNGKGGGIFNPVTLNVADGSLIGMLPDGQEQNCGEGVNAPTFYEA